MIRVAFGFLLHLSPARTTTTHSSSIRNQSGAAWEKRQLQSKSSAPASPPGPSPWAVVCLCLVSVGIFSSHSHFHLYPTLFIALAHRIIITQFTLLPCILFLLLPLLHFCLSALGLSLSMNRWKRLTTDLCTASGTIDLSLGGVSPTLFGWKFG